MHSSHLGADAEIGNGKIQVVVDEDVGRFDVLVHNERRVRVEPLQSGRHVEYELPYFFGCLLLTNELL